jgi:hypothetical protein
MPSSNDDPINHNRISRPEPPRAEPEIIPPGADFPPRPHREAFVFAHHGTRIHVARLGPFGIAMILLGAGALGAIGLLVLLGAVLVGAAVMGVVVAAALFSRLLRGPARPQPRSVRQG